MTMISANPAFLPVLRQVCSGADGFPVLLRRPLWRALLHYALLAVLCIVANLALRAVPTHRRLVRAVTAFESRFGRLIPGRDSLSPAIAPETARSLSLGQLRVDYFPDLATAQAFSPLPLTEPAGVLWIPTATLLWQKFDERRYSVMPFPAAMLFPGLEVKTTLPVLVDAGGVAAQLGHCAIMPRPGAMPGDTAENGPTTTAAGACSLHRFVPLGWVMLMLFVVSEGVVKSFFVAPSYILMFCLVMHLFRPRGVASPDLPGFLKLGFYAAFPGLIIAMLCSALELDFLQFHLVFSMTFLVWLFVVYGQLRRLTSRPEDNEEDFA